MENYRLDSETRNDAGKGNARKLRVTGRVPAILYGHKEAPMSLSIDEAQMRTILTKHPDSPIVDLTVGGKGKMNALVREVQRHPATGRILHVDFQRISLDEQVRVDVPVELVGAAVGVKDHGGILEHTMRSLEVECLPREIPESIILDVSALLIGDAIKLSDVQARYPDLTFGDEPEQVLVTVSPPRVEAVATGVEGEEGEAATEPELVSGKRDAEEDKEKDKDKEKS